MKLIKNNCILIIYILTFNIAGSLAQENTKRFTLDEVIDLAKTESPDALASKHRFISSYWQYNTFKANYLPVLTLDATVPTLNRSIQKYTNSDGTDSYIETSYLDNSMNLSLKKTVGATGGQLFMNTYLLRSDNFISNKTSYLSTPIVIGFSQPLSTYNYHRWGKKIEPLRFEEAKKRIIEESQDISIKALNIFFDVLIAQMNISIAEKNLANNDTLYKIAEKRFEFGKIAENELLQIQLAQLNSKNQLEQAKINYESNLIRFKSLLGIKDMIKIELIPPTKVFDIEVNVQKALTEAKTNRSENFSYERSLLEAESYLNNTIAQSRFNANLYCNFGLTQKSGQVINAYNNPTDQEKVTLGLSIPILNWGLSDGKVKMALSNQKLVQANIDQYRINFEQNIIFKVMMFNTQCNQLFVAAKADTISQKRYNVTKQRYLIGKISITEVNIALSDQDVARRSYFNSLRSYWAIFYELRRLTLYDFIQNEPITYDFSQFNLN